MDGRHRQPVVTRHGAERSCEGLGRLAVEGFEPDAQTQRQKLERGFFHAVGNELPVAVVLLRTRDDHAQSTDRAGRQAAGEQIGRVASVGDERLNLGDVFGRDPSSMVENTIDGADGNTRQTRDLLDRQRFRTVRSRPRARVCGHSAWRRRAWADRVPAWDQTQSSS